MRNYWYTSRANEIFIDTDNVTRSMKHTAARLLGAIECGRLQIEKIEYHYSRSENHIHTLITLKNEMPAQQRYIWALILHSDIYRAAATMMREINGVGAPDVFITPELFNRAPDDFCECESKHNAATMFNCPAAIRLRGENRVRGFFGKPDNRGWSLQDITEYINSKSGDLF